jgi:toxin ParE1/3/4
MTRLAYLPAALADLKAITLYIAEDNPDRAITFVEELRAKAQQALERPESFPARDDLSPGLRVARHGRYLLFFHKVEDEIQIVRVMHGARDLAQILNS